MLVRIITTYQILTGPAWMIKFWYIHLDPCMREGMRLDEQRNACINQHKCENQAPIARTINISIINYALEHKR